MSDSHEHEIMTEEMNRLKSEIAFITSLLNEGADVLLKKYKKENVELKEENAILKSNIIQLQCLGKSDEYSG